MKKSKTKLDWKFVYYSPEIDELFTLTLEPPKPHQVLKLYVDDKLVLKHVIYLGEL